MLMKGEELGLSPIKCQNKEGTEELKKLHYEVNDILFKYKKRYVSRKDAVDIYNRMCQIGTKMNGLKLPERAKAKRDEILGKMRAMTRAVDHYADNFEWTDDDAPKIQATINYQLKRMVDAKKSGEVYIHAYKYLEENNEIMERFFELCSPTLYLDIEHFKEFNNSLVKRLCNQYTIV